SISRFLSCYRAHSPPHSFPTRRSSDLRPSPRARCSFPRSRCRSGSNPINLPLPSIRTTDQPNRPHLAGSAKPEKSRRPPDFPLRSEEHTSELQSRENLVCRLLLEKKQI